MMYEPELTGPYQGSRMMKVYPTISPSMIPSGVPSMTPTSVASMLPSTVNSTKSPSEIPSISPSGAPSQAPSKALTAKKKKKDKERTTKIFPLSYEKTQITLQAFGTALAAIVSLCAAMISLTSADTNLHKITEAQSKIVKEIFQFRMRVVSLSVIALKSMPEEKQLS